MFSFLIGCAITGAYVAGGKLFLSPTLRDPWLWLLFLASPITVPLALIFLLVVY